MALGTCSRCGRETRSQSYMYCKKCAIELHVCQLCGKPLPSSKSKFVTLCETCKNRPVLM